jgi:imidazolonepropionase-like amidohydrolase
VDSVEHGAYLDADALAAMAEHGTVWVPTISTVGNLRGKGRFEEGAVSRIYESAAENIRQFAAMGGLLGCGSDAGAWAVPHGCGSEEQLLRDILGDQAPEIWRKGNERIKEKF